MQNTTFTNRLIRSHVIKRIDRNGFTTVGRSTRIRTRWSWSEVIVLDDSEVQDIVTDLLYAQAYDADRAPTTPEGDERLWERAADLALAITEGVSA